MKGHLSGVMLSAWVLVVSGGLSPGVLHGESKSALFAIPSQEKPAQAKEVEPFPDVLRVTSEEVQRLAKGGAKVVMVDTDDPVAYESEHIQGAVNIPYDPTRDAHEQDQTLSALPGDRLVVFYCNCAHEEDSAPLVKEMWDLGYDHDKVKALKGGLARWEHLKFPLAGSDVKPSEPAHR
ncbi:MAG: rhodanese-like domain-containing protein [Candidatus Acidiferrales bacterium]